MEISLDPDNPYSWRNLFLITLGNPSSFIFISKVNKITYIQNNKYTKVAKPAVYKQSCFE